MEPALTTGALALHDLGIAAGFGGALFGKYSLGPAVRGIEDEKERGKVLEAAWNRYKWVNGISLGAVALTWLAGRSAFSGRILGRRTRNLVLTKDVLIGTTVAATIAASAIGSYLGAENGGYVPTREGGKPSPNATPEQKTAQRAVSIVGTVNLLAMAGVIGVTGWLMQRASSSHRWAGISRLLP
ncbi:MAG TPA: hypothetical protein VGH20_16710 [Myxococcales bacterium]|jgi:hypothetical protein